MFELNSRAWNGGDELTQKGKKLDSSIKKNTGFIKKLKQGISKDSKDSLVKDLGEISLEKYLSELVVTANEGLYKVPGRNDDIVAAVEVISALHQRFGTRFTPSLMELFLHSFANPAIDLDSEKEELARVMRLRCHVRIFTELYLVGIFNTLEYCTKDNLPEFVARKLSKKEPILFTILREVLNHKFKTGVTTIIATNFVKRYPQFLADDDNSLDRLIVDENLKRLVNSLLKIFTDAVIAQTLELNKRLLKLKREHQKAQIRTGRSTDEYLEEHDSLIPLFERFEAAALVLSESFKLDMPKLEKLTDSDVSASPSSMITNQVKNSHDKLWENDEMRKFYEVLPDVKDIIKSSSESSDELRLENLNKFFSALELADSKEVLDELATRYWSTGLDNKATRKRLLRFFIETQDWSKLSLYARYVATNAETMPDIKEELIQYLDNGFRNQLHSNKINVKNIIFFSEMVKFMLVPSFLIFHKIRTLILNIQIPNNIEILTVLFENFGRFLINNTAYSAQMEKMIDLIREKKKEHELPISNKCALDNLIVLVYPPSLSKLNSETKKYSPEQQFYRILIRRELHNIKADKVIRLVRKAHWNDSHIVETFFSLFTKPEKVGYQSLETLSRVLSGIYPYYRSFVLRVIDTILEKIERGLELNEFSMNMKRIADVKYLTLIFNKNLIKFEVLLNAMYKIIKFGYLNGQPNPFLINDLDLPDNYFRIQLISTILLSLEKITPKLTKKITLFMRFFEFYILTKDRPLPKETEFKISDVFDKFAPNETFERCHEVTESAQKLAEMLEDMGLAGSSNALEYPEEEEEEEDDEDVEEVPDEEEAASSDDRESGDDVASDDSAEEEDAENSGDTSTDDDTENEDSDEDVDNYMNADRDFERRRIQEEREGKLRDEEERKAEEELERQFQSIVLESMESRKNQKTTTNNIPMFSSGVSPDQDKETYNLTNSDTPDKSQRVAFTFLSKSGKKTQARTLALPRNLKFVSDVLEEEQRVKSEREKIKKIVLNRKFD